MSSRISRYLLACGLSLLAWTLPALAEEEAAEAPAPQDEILLQNGSRIIGQVTGSRDGVLTVETDFAGTLSVSLDSVASVSTVEPVTIQLTDESVVQDQPLRIEEDVLVVADASGAEQSLGLDQLMVVNPEPWEIGQGYKWSGLVNFAFAVERGNSDTDELDYKLDTNLRSDDDRYTLKIDGEIDEANDQKNADNWTIQGKYDYFLENDNYWGFQLLAEQDEFADLDLRYFVGPYYGKEFFTDDIFFLSAELGASYVNEDFITAPDQEYPGANWQIHMSSNYLGGDSRLYFDQLGVWNLDETSDYLVNTTFGLAFPLLWGFEAAAEVLFEYDAGAVEGVEKLDETYAFRLGYTW